MNSARREKQIHYTPDMSDREWLPSGGSSSGCGSVSELGEAQKHLQGLDSGAVTRFSQSLAITRTFRQT